MAEQLKTRVLLVCLGNICRSPLAEGILRKEAHSMGLQDFLVIDSAGTSGYHAGEAPDPRAVEVARDFGIDIAGLRSRPVNRRDYEIFDWMLAMDGNNLTVLERQKPLQSVVKLDKMTSWHPEAKGVDVPDPYYGSASDFAALVPLLVASSRGFLEHLFRSG